MIKNKGVCRTAPAPPGLLSILLDQKLQLFSECVDLTIGGVASVRVGAVCNISLYFFTQTKMFETCIGESKPIKHVKGISAKSRKEGLVRHRKNYSVASLSKLKLSLNNTGIGSI